MIHFYYGEEPYQLSAHLRSVQHDFLQSNPTAEYIVFECDEVCDIYDIIASFGTQSLFAQQKMIIIKNFFAATKADIQKELLSCLEKKSDDMIIIVENHMPRKNAQLFVWLKEYANVVYESKVLQGNNLEKWIVQLCTKNNGHITPDAVRELTLCVGNDLWHLSQEINKLVCYVGKNDITPDVVRNIVHGRIDADIFQTIDAVVSGNKTMALMLLKKQLAKGDAAFQIFGMYAYQVRTLLGVSSMVYESGITEKSIIAKTLKIHPFVVQKTLATAQRFSLQEVKKMHKKLTLLDGDVKQGKRDINCALDLFITST